MLMLEFSAEEEEEERISLNIEIGMEDNERR